MVFNLPKKILLSIIKIYQRTLSLDHGPLKFIRPYGQCKFHPTCSVYTYQAIETHGALKGSWWGLKRLIRCHPWSKGGYDPINK